MAFEDEARRIGADFLILLPGNLRERAKFIRERWGINISYSSYAKQWNSLLDQFGIADSVKKILEYYMEKLQLEAEACLRKSTRESVSPQDIDSLQLWGLIDYETGKIADLGSFVLTYGPDLSRKIGRLSAARIYQISACIHCLLQARQNDKVVFQDGSVEKDGDCLTLGYLQRLEKLLEECNLAPREQNRLHGLVDSFQAKYRKQVEENPYLDSEDHANLLRILQRVEASVDQEIMSRDFAELRPTTGILDYQKLPSEVLTDLLGEASYSVPPIVMQDLEEGVKCLKFGAPTASVMVSLRAVEGWLRELYTSLTGQETKKAWGELLKGIREALSERDKSIEPVIGFLDYVRNVRNKANHPDTIFDQISAEQTFMAATTAIRELQKLQGS